MSAVSKKILNAKNIHKAYPLPKGELPVLKGIDLEIGTGEIVAVIGPSGVGKSTLLHVLGALDRPSAGQVHLDDEDVFAMSDDELADFRNRRIGFVFQFHHLLPEFSALENVAMPALIARTSKVDAFKRARQLLEDVGLSQRMQHKPREMSGGEQQRVAFARALTNEPALVLADEPSGNLDLKSSQALHQLMWNLVRDKQQTFVIVTHNRELAGEADRIIELFDGRIR